MVPFEMQIETLQFAFTGPVRALIWRDRNEQVQHFHIQHTVHTQGWLIALSVDLKKKKSLDYFHDSPDV